MHERSDKQVLFQRFRQFDWIILIIDDIRQWMKFVVEINAPVRNDGGHARETRLPSLCINSTYALKEGTGQENNCRPDMEHAVWSEYEINVYVK